MLTLTGKTRPITYNGITFPYCNQRCPDWTHPYPYQGSHADLYSSGCGIFSVFHAAYFLGGNACTPEELADFSCRCGGRGDDGTDRPALLHGMQTEGLAARFGFAYHEDGLRNDTDTLYDHLLAGNAALCNLRVGHIVALIGAREMDGEKQVLVIDSANETNSERVRDNIRQIIPDTEVISAVRNASGMTTAVQVCHAMYWACLSTVRDFNLLHRINA